MGSVVNSVVGTVFGTSSDAGILGTGQYSAQRYNVDKNAFQNATSAADRAAALQQAGIQTGRSAEQYAQGQEARGTQAQLAQALQAQARGEGPSLAQNQLQSALQQNLQAQQAAAASNKSVPAALAARMIGQQASAARSQAALDSANIRAQEQLNAQQALGSLASQMRSQDMSGTGAADAAQLAQAQYASDLSEQDRAARIAEQQLRVQEATGANQVNAGAYESASKRRGDMVSGIGAALAMSDENAKTNVKSGAEKTQSFLEKFGEAIDKQNTTKDGEAKSGQYGAGKAIGQGLMKMFASEGASSGAAAMSDENSKTDVKSSDNKLKSFLDALKAHEYEYKASKKDLPGAGEGKHVSPMAQELEKTELGKQMVVDTPEGKVVDYGKGFGTMLASMATLNERTSELEKALKAKKGNK